MSDLHDALDRRAQTVERWLGPAFDPLEPVLRTAAHRRRRREVTNGILVVALLSGALVGLGTVPSVGPSDRPVALSQLVGTKSALQLREDLGIQGLTKGAPLAVLADRTSADGTVGRALVEVPTGTTVSLPGTSETSISPDGGVVAGVQNDQLVVTSTTPRPASTPAVVPDTGGATGPVSWGRGGNALFAMVHGRWVRVSHPDSAQSRNVRELNVPSIPGGPILLSVSPDAARALLFGITYAVSGAPVPHLYLGRFDGTSVSDLRSVDVPDTALSGPLGWVGDNAFILAPGAGLALIVRTDGSTVPVRAASVGDPCQRSSARSSCVADGPWLLGTNFDGSLLFWRLSAMPEPRTDPDGAARPPILVVYFKTWLDGTHAIRLTGPAGTYGPPVAAR